MWRKNSVPPWQSSGRLRYRIPDQCDESTCTFARPTSPARVIRNFACDSVGGIGLSGSPTSRDTASVNRSEEHTSELQSLMRTSYAVFCLKKKKKKNTHT